MQNSNRRGMTKIILALLSLSMVILLFVAYLSLGQNLPVPSSTPTPLRTLTETPEIPDTPSPSETPLPTKVPSRTPPVAAATVEFSSTDEPDRVGTLNADATKRSQLTITAMAVGDGSGTTVALTATALMSNISTATANSKISALVARETTIAQTSTPLPANLTPSPAMTQVATIVVNDAYGKRIGNGQILVRAPSTMQPNSEAKIRVEIELFPLSNEPTLEPRPTATPLEAALKSSPTPIPTIEGGSASADIYEFTSVQLDGLNMDRFNLKPDLTNDVRRIVRGVRYSWQWSISPRDAANGLTTDFEALIFAQHDLSAPRVVVTRVPFRISVRAPLDTKPLIAIIGVFAILIVAGVLVITLRRRPPNWGTGRIFISYRRADTRDMTERIRDEMAQYFGDAAIFKDIGSIEYGSDYRKRLEESVQRAEVVIAMIGQQYLTITDTSTRERRLFQAEDFVRLEVELGLQGNKIVIPVLVNGAAMPKADEFPPSIRELAFRNALPVRPDPDFHVDMQRLRQAIEKALKAPKRS